MTRAPTIPPTGLVDMSGKSKAAPQGTAHSPARACVRVLARTCVCVCLHVRMHLHACIRAVCERERRNESIASPCPRQSYTRVHLRRLIARGRLPSPLPCRLGLADAADACAPFSRFAACADTLIVSGAESVPYAEGTYRKVAFGQGDHPLYQKTNASLTAVYLFYWPPTREWRIGNSHTAAAAVVRSRIDAALCPNDVVTWCAAQGTSCSGSDIYPIAVKALTLPPVWVLTDGNAAPLRTGSAATRKLLRRCAQCSARERRLARPPHALLARALAFGPRLRPTAMPYAREHTHALPRTGV